MKYVLKYIGSFLLFALLTLVTQVGGVIYLACLPLFRFLKKYIRRPIGRVAANITAYTAIYALITFFIIPPMAGRFGRVPLPMNDENPHLKQWNRWLCFFNRHYVVPELRAVTEGVAQKMAEKQEGTVTVYLESGFPFFEGFPLLPHRTHNDGRKIDLAFFYTDAKTKEPTNDRPSWLGYGVCEEPKAGEEDRPSYCAEKGFWQYSFMKNYIVSQRKKQDLPFDAVRTREMVRLFINDNRVQTVLIEPHLKKRLGFENQNKLRLHSCEAVRHDDHLHVAVY